VLKEGGEFEFLLPFLRQKRKEASVGIHEHCTVADILVFNR
jgi:hypothetical protein